VPGDPYDIRPTTAQTAAKGRAAVATDSTITLTAFQPNTWGAAFFQVPIQLFSFALKAEIGDGFAFVIAASDTVTGGSTGSSDGSGGSGSLGYAGMDERSITVEFDTAKNTDANDPNNNHVGLRVSGKTTSIATAKAPVILNDGKPKHAWVIFDPTRSSSSSSSSSGSPPGVGSLQVFLSASASPQLSRAALSVQVSLCRYLKPSKQEASFLMGFTASPTTANSPHRAGVQPLEAPGGAGLGGEGEEEEVWVVSQAFFSADLGLPWPVKNQGACGDCWAYAVVGSVEMAYGILTNLARVPLLSVTQLREALGSSCSQGNSPSLAFQYLVTLNAKASVGLVEEGKAGAVARKALGGPYRVNGFERTAFHGWFGLLLVVQRQPVVVHVQATAPSFLNHDGLSKYADSECFTYNLNHVVLLVGYRLTGPDPTFPHMAPPFWIIRNSWGPQWGDGGQMRMDIQGATECVGSTRCLGSTRWLILLAACAVTCLEDACRAAVRNPCAVGTCVNDGKGSYSCVCPPGFRQGTTVDGTFSCAPGDSSSKYAVVMEGLTCADIHPMAPLVVGTVVSVLQPPSLTPCSVYYTTSEGDTCESLATYFSLTAGCSTPTAPCAAAFAALNPGLDCSGGASNTA
ncbi:unnamed protein product, partial [Closterium sp. NIES-64]